MTLRPTRIALCFGVLLGLGMWQLPAAHSGAPGTHRAAERPPGPPGRRTGPATEGRQNPEEVPQPSVCRVCRLAGRLELRMTPLLRPTRYRCPGPPRPALHAVRPHGLVTAEALTHIRVDLGEALCDRADLCDRDSLRLEFRMGAAVLGHLDLPLEYSTTTLEIPPALRARLRAARGCVRWGVFGVEGDRATASLWIEPPSADLRRALESLELALAREPLWIRHVLRAQAHLDAGFALRALDYARAALDLRPDEPHASALVRYTQLLLGYQGTDDAFEADRRVDRVLAAHERHPRMRNCRLGEALPQAQRQRLPRAGCGDHGARGASGRAGGGGTRR